MKDQPVSSWEPVLFDKSLKHRNESHKGAAETARSPWQQLRCVRLPLGVIVQAKHHLHGDDDERGGLQVVPRQDGTRPAVQRVALLICHTCAVHQDADPPVQLV